MMITLTASSDFNTAGKQFVARIAGRDKKFTFARDFIGRRSGKRHDYTSADIDDEGLYETRDTTRKGTDDSYHLVWLDGETLCDTSVDKEDAMTLAKSLPTDWAAEGRRREIASLIDSVARSREKNQDGIVTNVRVGSEYRTAWVRRDLIAAREAEIERLTAASEHETDVAKTKRGIDLSL